MPNVRVTVTIDTETKKLLDDLSDAMDTSFGKLAGSLLDDARPQLQNFHEAVNNAKSDPGASYTTMHLALIEAQRQALEAQSDFLQDIADKRKSNTDT